ncbi:MAG: glycosyltransferase family 4 protein [Clostridia bacterium]|nr:glycosyltransferase family 4 protein [Clostridia bacterium]
MKKKILIFSIYPAPYRVNLFNYFFENFDVDIFFETSGGDERNEKWFTGGKYYTLDSAEGLDAYRKMNVKSYDLAVFYEYSTKMSVKLIFECRLKSVPYVINCDGVMLTEHGNAVKEIVKRFLISGAAACLASGEHAKQYFLKYGAKEEKIYLHTFSTLNEADILPSPLKSDEKRELRGRLGLPQNSKIAIAVGRFIPLKRYNELIAAWDKMPDDCYLLLIGGGDEETKYRETIERLGLKNVIIEPFHPKDELFDYFKSSDIFVHPTSYDVWGLVVNEAMACGLPIVVSDHCIAGLELIKDGVNGYVIPMGNDTMMCRRTEEILSDTENYDGMAKNVLDTIRPYTLENMAKKHIDVFNKILKR